MSSQAVVVLGMHRSGTSVIAHALTSLGVYLGDNMMLPQDDNPAGFWEDNKVVEINDKILELFGMTWSGLSRLEVSSFDSPEIKPLEQEALEYLNTHFSSQKIWGFKDPRTIRVFPFWQRVFAALPVGVKYVVAVRNPQSIEASLRKRDNLDKESVYNLWLIHMVPFMEQVAQNSFVVVDYDLFMQDPERQIKRIGDKLTLPMDEGTTVRIQDFVKASVDKSLRHTTFNPETYDVESFLATKCHEYFIKFHTLAEDHSLPDNFWTEWKTIYRQIMIYLDARASVDKLSFELEKLKRRSEDLDDAILKMEARLTVKLENINSNWDYMIQVMESFSSWQKRSWAKRTFHRWKIPKR